MKTVDQVQLDQQYNENSFKLMKQFEQVKINIVRIHGHGFQSFRNPTNNSSKRKKGEKGPLKSSNFLRKQKMGNLLATRK